MEAYGAAVKDLKVRYEIAASPEGAALLAADVPPRAAGDERAIFNRTLPVRQLPPGSYTLRAVLTAETGLAKSPLNLLRPFEIAPPAVLMTSADSTAPAPPSATELFLPVGEEVFARPFDRTSMGRAPVLETFRTRVAPVHTAAFDKGVAALEAGDYGTAESSFKAAISPTEDSTAGAGLSRRDLCRIGTRSRGGERVADGAHRRRRNSRDLPVARRHAAARARPAARASGARGSRRQVAGRPPVRQAAGDALRDDGARPRGRADHAAPSGGAACRRRRVVHGRRVDLQPAHARGRGPVEARGPEAGTHLRRRLRAREGAAGGAREAMDSSSSTRCQPRGGGNPSAGLAGTGHPGMGAGPAAALPGRRRHHVGRRERGRQ